MNLLLIGYGKMGKAIEEMAKSRGHHIAYVIDLHNQDQLLEIAHSEVDAAIEFTQPESAFYNIRTCLEKGIPVISGTTGWLHKREEIENLCLQRNGAFFYASNYSIGVNIFFKLNSFLAKMMKGFKEYDVKIEEIHHTEKKDAPSGTAITLAEGILKEVGQKRNWVNKSTGNAGDLVIESKREGVVPGTHIVNYYSTIDNIEIKHTAHSREGFALGAVLVAEWIQDKKGNLAMDDFLKL
jgi:4-hydroxy-tetrahydrodipicolinate reductase